MCEVQRPPRITRTEPEMATEPGRERTIDATGRISAGTFETEIQINTLAAILSHNSFTNDSPRDDNFVAGFVQVRPHENKILLRHIVHDFIAALRRSARW